MNRRKLIWLAGAFALCLFAGGWIWWRGSYEEFLKTGFHLETLPLFAGAAIVLTWIVGTDVRASGLAVGAAFPAIMLTRVILG